MIRNCQRMKEEVAGVVATILDFRGLNYFFICIYKQKDVPLHSILQRTILGANEEKYLDIDSTSTFVEQRLNLCY